MLPLTGKKLEWTVIATCCFAFVLFGYDQGVLAGLVSTPEFLDTFNNPSSGLLGTIVAIYDIGCVVGSLGTIAIGDVLGRRRTIMLGCILVSRLSDKMSKMGLANELHTRFASVRPCKVPHSPFRI